MANQCSIEGCQGSYECKGYCKRHYQRWRRHGDPLISLRRAARPLADRFWTYVDKSTTPNGCWEWTGGRSRFGYGIMEGRNGKTINSVHRLAYELQVGPIPSGLEVCHTCDNRPCQRGDHLFAATHLDNMRDMARKNRANRIPSVQGSKAHNAKLTEAMIPKIRELKSKGIAQADIAATYDIDSAIISDILRGKRWKHV